MGAQMCPKHGTDYLEYKCRYCCSWPYFSVSEPLIFATPVMTTSNVWPTCPNMSCPNAQLGPKVPNWKGTSAHSMCLTRPLVKSMHWAVEYVETRIHSENKTKKYIRTIILLFDVYNKND